MINKKERTGTEKKKKEKGNKRYKGVTSNLFYSSYKYILCFIPSGSWLPSFHIAAFLIIKLINQKSNDLFSAKSSKRVKIQNSEEKSTFCLNFLNTCC